jgi:hypothetical protein
MKRPIPIVTGGPGLGCGGISAISAGWTVKVATTATAMPSAEMMPNSARPE